MQDYYGFLIIRRGNRAKQSMVFTVRGENGTKKELLSWDTKLQMYTVVYTNINSVVYSVGQ